MNKFLKDKENKYFEEKQKYIRETLSYHLSENVKENEYEFKTRNNEPLGFCESTSTLCFTLEAIFLHGLKESFLQILSNFGSDETQKPNPTFWSFVSKFLHKQDIKDIQSLSQLSTEIGYCRAFIRKAFNESLISSYLQNIRKSPSTLKSYYHPYAFFFDAELTDTAEGLLRGIESYVVFDLPCNSSLLNVWNDAPLQLSGIYAVALKNLPFLVGEDVAGLMISTTSRNIDIPPQRCSVLSDIYTASISNSIFSDSPSSALGYGDDEGISKFLTRTDSGDEAPTDVSEKMCESVDEDVLTENNQSLTLPIDVEKMQESQDEATPENAIGNSLVSNRSFWSEPVASKSDTKEVEEDNAESGPAEIVYRRTVSSHVAIDNHSFESLWNEKQRKSSENFRDVWNKFQRTINITNMQKLNIPEGNEDFPEDFEVLMPENGKMDELEHMVEVLCRLSTESGLDQQGFMCKECKSPLVDISKAIVCAFDGHYYCSSCISKDKYAIPSKIIYNWDFTQYNVSKKAADFISNYQFKPFIDFKILNPDIYSYIDEMNNLQKLRIQLNFIRAYIFTCSESTIGELQKLLYGKEYIYESIHLYSVSDLYLINQNGALQDMLKRVVNFGREHCLKCVLCSVKGFICEYCRRSKIIYPFDVDETMRCNACGTISHINCFNPAIPCPKCDRKSKRVSALETHG
ncbi:uncharacterized protein Plekhm1 [Chironomus tepperi]|uniref:uncharacterized protein Plekhm1 n=1 Tax=Chironomus tepperi TaxID=113505 RepID=UPI00391F04A8